jgi:hypothetical protein
MMIGINYKIMTNHSTNCQICSVSCNRRKHEASHGHDNIKHHQKWTFVQKLSLNKMNQFVVLKKELVID